MTIKHKKITELKPHDRILIQSANTFYEIIYERIDVYSTPDGRSYYYLYGQYTNANMQYIQSMYTENNEIPSVVCMENDQKKTNPIQIPTRNVPEFKTASTSAQTVGTPGFIQDLEQDYKQETRKRFEEPITIQLIGTGEYLQNNMRTVKEALDAKATDLSRFLLDKPKNIKEPHERMLFWKKFPNAKYPQAIGFLPKKITGMLDNFTYDYAFDIVIVWRCSYS